MKRLHVFEFSDQRWCPAFIRKAITDCLWVYYRQQDVYQGAFIKIKELLDELGIENIIDCCSGSGGPIEMLRSYLDEKGNGATKITLTDKYPDKHLFDLLESLYPGRVNGYKEPADITAMPSQLEGLRTLFSAFHHFSPRQALRILQNSVDNDAPIAIFECTERRIGALIPILLTPLYCWRILPKARNLTWAKIVFSYIFPLIPFIHAWEFMVSSLRTYTISELKELIKQIDAPHYRWKIGMIDSKAQCRITYLIGYNLFRKDNF